MRKGERRYWLKLVVRALSRPENLLRRRVSILRKIRLGCAPCAKAAARMQPGMYVPFAMGQDCANKVIVSMKTKFDRLTGASLVLSGILASHALTLCAVIFSDPFVACSLPAHWCAGYNESNGIPRGVGSAVFVVGCAIWYIIKRIRKSSTSRSTIEAEKRQAFEREQAKIKAEEAACLQEEAARQQEEDRQRSLCPQCQGSGMDQNGVLCPRCHGKGVRQEVVCGVCEGRGVNSTGNICPNCGGRGQCFEN